MKLKYQNACRDKFSAKAKSIYIKLYAFVSIYLSSFAHRYVCLIVFHVLSFAVVLDSQRNHLQNRGAVGGDKRVESSGRKSDHAPSCSRLGLLASPA